MLFHFEGRNEPEDILEAIRPIVQVLLDAGITHVSDMYISLRGFSGDTECQIVDKDELISQLYFDRSASGQAGTHVCRRNGSFIRKRPADMPHGGLGTFFNHND